MTTDDVDNKRTHFQAPPTIQQADPTKTVFRARVYGGGWRVADFGELAPGLVLLSPMRPPERAQGHGGLFIPGSAIGIAGTMCKLHRVEAVAPNVTRVKVGDACVARLTHMDPLDEKGDFLIVEEKYIYAPVHDSMADVRAS